MTAVTPIELAKQWATHQSAILVLEAKAAEIKHDLDNARIRREDCERELRGGLGPQVPQRLFDIGEGQIVMVSVTRGVELVEVEKAHAPK
jgi:hypothetical protein